ncbi:MAG3720 family protein [Mycoplasma tauri]|uniref:MAG3720 family protein n=1 Tax=Mycoplasma tauri TaxID=547987 RepID=UPI001CBFA43C|nr:hypothetical protein [Mycoplasma tauri]MBZ4218535.1 hypothetical protein [Mycoplasma tauri]
MNRVEKQDYFGLFYIKKSQVQFVLSTYIGGHFFSVINNICDYKIDDLAKLESIIKEAKNYISNQNKKNKQKTNISYIAIIDDAYANSKINDLQFLDSNHCFDLENKKVNEKTISEYNEKMSNFEFKINRFILSYKTFLYEIKDENGFSKQYGDMPVNKSGSKLITHQKLITFSKESDIVSLINKIKTFNITIKHVFLKSQCLDLQKPDNKFKFTLNFSWNFINVIGQINDNTFFYDKTRIKTKAILEVLSKLTSVSNDNFSLQIDAINNNFDLLKSLDDRFIDKKIYKIFETAIKQVGRLIKEKIEIGASYPSYEIIVSGKHSAFVVDVLKDIFRGITISELDNRESIISKIDNHFLGATYIANEYAQKRDIQLELLNTIPLAEVKNNTTINKILNSFHKKWLNI